MPWPSSWRSTRSPAAKWWASPQSSATWTCTRPTTTSRSASWMQMIDTGGRYSGLNDPHCSLHLAVSSRPRGEPTSPCTAGRPRQSFPASRTRSGKCVIEALDSQSNARPRTDVAVLLLLLLLLQGHGPDGLGGESGKVEASLTTARRNEAVHALIDLAHKYSGEMVIAAVGPLTNIALAILLDPDFMSDVKQLVVMGGLARGEGNHTAHAEFNVSCDPEATDIVYQHCSAKKLYVVPFETCVDSGLSWETFDQIFHEEVNAHGEYIKKIWKFTRSFCKHEGFLPCDAYAIAILLHPEYIKTAPMLKGRIHLAPDEKRGACIWNYDSPPNEANVTLVTEIDTRVFEDLLRHLAA
ncbi:unnamed protein product [Phytophthora fragariaefolia]|uniref:Unnamed protein product n=1 Tax=Phytophthora fragariaefolia TaxID=1490495 RepID=A0A9W6TJM6_9STRA|nr:unnamed protein product [Phytophthora fragariaefolia]